jgi:serine/threonine protein kinase
MYYLNASQDNILVSDQGVAQITDFGIARILGVEGYTTMIRNVRYAAPELRPLGDIDLEQVRPTTASDIFSFGILLLQVRPYKLRPLVDQILMLMLSHDSYFMDLIRMYREAGRTTTYPIAQMTVTIGCSTSYMGEKGRFENDITSYRTHIGCSWSAAGQLIHLDVQGLWKY